MQAFIALLIASVLAGMEPLAVIQSMRGGMRHTWFYSHCNRFGRYVWCYARTLWRSKSYGGAKAMANYLLRVFGEKNTSSASTLSGFLIAIPVFFDVAFIILIPLIYFLQRCTKKSLVLYAISLLAGLAITHSFIPPTLGPIAVADILKAD